ncbi:hypothetical protein SKAU_G00416300 [Synaphobranchus kaupii]|uniref:Uncharacterized protein n=1 Tax=Synaphobranchus kaupii TaxID=118154 RepID=A0A9Q1E7J8_SYNKA|nr:hypothetical protein SKAU_G00416300 [Synaphobranchus kaupii]
MDLALWYMISLFIVILNSYFSQGYNHDYAAGGTAREIHYSRETLLLLRNTFPDLSQEFLTIVESLPNCFKKDPSTSRTKRKRGCKGGTRHRLKRLRNKLPLPTALLINAQSLRAKTDELSANTRYLHEYRDACVLAITETWLDNNIKSSVVEPSGFSAFRTDRDPIITEKAEISWPSVEKEQI